MSQLNPRVRQLLVVFTSVALVTLARVPMMHYGLNVSYMPYFLAIVVSALAAGWPGSLLAIFLSVLCGTMYRLANVPKFNTHSPTDYATLALFILCGLGISAISLRQGVARREAEDSNREAHQREEDLKKSEERYRKLIRDANEGMMTVDANDLITFVNPSFAEMIGYDASEMIGMPVYTIFFPEDIPLARNRRADRRRGIAEQYESRLRCKDGGEIWAVCNVSVMQDGGEYQGTFTMFTDITYRKEAESELAAAYRRELMLNRVAEGIRQSLDIEEVQRIAIEALGATLGADRCASIVVDKERDMMRFVHEWRRPDLPKLIGEYRTGIFHESFATAFPGGRTLVVDDINATDISDKTREQRAKMRIRSMIKVPLFEDGEVVGILAVYMADEPRHWTDDEISLVEATTAQLRSAMDATRLLAESEARAERSALLNRIGQALRASLDADLIQQKVAELVGQALNVDRCYFATYDTSRDFVYTSGDWRRSDLSSIAGESQYHDIEPFLTELFKNGTAVISDVSTQLSPEIAAEQAKNRNHATLAVPLYDNQELVAALFAVMTDEPRSWTTDEISIVEQVAVLTRTTVESARMREREHRIATRLQEALQPALPEYVPGLRLAEFYRPGLDEAEVGGDFADCFATDKGLTYLIVGDLSGKGLAAAAQVAVVRNMLRFALYNDVDLARSINRLNRTLADNGMIMGFATLFVGCFDSSDRILRYVNCAQEPGLLRRKSGEILQLPPTGSVLGTLPDAQFTESSVSIEPGDTLAIFTDGLTEAGPERSQLLGIEGVADLLDHMPHLTAPREVVDALISGVDQYAEGGQRDDVCLLVAVAGP